MRILGISAYYHDAAAALVIDGQLIAAAQEERFTRVRHDERCPVSAAAYCLREAGLAITDLDHVIFYDKPFRKFERLLSTYLDTFPRGLHSFLHALPIWMKDKLWTRALLQSQLGWRGEVLFNSHHLSHAASAFLVSPFDEAAILTVDGVGEWATSALSTGIGSRIELLQETHFPHSLGLLYSAFTYYLGFKVNSAEYKVMGLAPYGEPRFVDKVRQVADIRPDGSFRLNLRYFDYVHGLRMTSRRFDELFGGPPRQPETRLTQREFDIAASIQKVTDEIMVAMARHLRTSTGQRHLCLAGGVALNCVSNARIFHDAGFDSIWIQPAAGDAGGALGAAFYLQNSVLGHPRTFVMNHAHYGPAFTPEEIRAVLTAAGANWTEPDERELLAETARCLAAGEVVGWFDGRMEFGPRALGARSILADPRDPAMKDTVNQKIKFREGFRPFAPSVPLEDAPAHFDFPAPLESPFMLLVATVPESAPAIPAVTHADRSARLQTVRAETNPRYHALLKEFGRQTGVPVLLNTSFNVRGEPIVCTPADAYRCFMRTGMDTLVLGSCLLSKAAQAPFAEDASWRKSLALD